MISSEQALQTILDRSQDFGIEEIPFSDALNRVLKEDILADRDFPPFDRVSMDGIAIQYSEFADGGRNFAIEGIQAAGSPQLALKKPENCLEVMTGAILPENTDTVIRYEDISINDGIASINIATVTENQNVHQKGIDRKQDDILIRKNTLISSAEMGVLSTVGKITVKVARRPQVMIISTGDELIDVAEKPLKHQIRKSNVYTLISLLEQLNIDAKTAHLNDDKELLTNKIASFLDAYDVLLFSGGVSKGKFDYLPEVLDSLKVEKLFHKVAQRPGKPFWFGTKESTCVFAFPGNPVSTFVGCLKYFYPWYRKSVEIPYLNEGKAILGEDFTFNPELTYFLQVKLDVNGGLKIAKPVVGNGSGDLANLVDVDGFLELPADQSQFTAGETFPLIRFR